MLCYKLLAKISILLLQLLNPQQFPAPSFSVLGHINIASVYIYIGNVYLYVCVHRNICIYNLEQLTLDKRAKDLQLHSFALFLTIVSS
jgi:hypothetical protein